MVLVASGFSWFALTGAPEPYPLWITAWVVCGLLVVGALIARMGLQRAMARPGLERYFPDERLTPRTFVEVYASALLGLMREIMGEKDARIFFPLIGALFGYILANNLFGLVPGVIPPTENINANFGMALIVFLTFNAVGLIRDPKGYVLHLFGPVWWIGPALFVIECIGLLVRPVSLSLRLTGNIFGDHTVFGMMSALMPHWLIPVPAIFLGLGLLVSFIQAFVFSLLTMIYIGLATPHHEGEGEHHH